MNDSTISRSILTDIAETLEHRARHAGFNADHATKEGRPDDAERWTGRAAAYTEAHDLIVAALASAMTAEGGA